jgi:hypothetical protein
MVRGYPNKNRKEADMPEVQINLLKNRLYITLEDWDQGDMPVYVQKIESACKALVPGFTCVAVLRKNGLIRQIDKDLLFNTTDLISAYGVSKVAYVRNNQTKENAMPSISINIHSYVPVHYAPNINEAEAILDGKSPAIMPLKRFAPAKKIASTWMN